jgi:hypothetical protein
MMNNQHATRLREMAAGNCRWAIAYKYETDPISQIRLNSLHEDAAALLAGAEALEAVEVAKAALRGLVAALDQVHEDPYYQRVWNVHQLYCGPYKGKKYEAELKQATAALARLEGK